MIGLLQIPPLSQHPASARQPRWSRPPSRRHILCCPTLRLSWRARPLPSLPHLHRQTPRHCWLRPLMSRRRHLAPEPPALLLLSPLVLLLFLWPLLLLLRLLPLVLLQDLQGPFPGYQRHLELQMLPWRPLQLWHLVLERRSLQRRLLHRPQPRWSAPAPHIRGADSAKSATGGTQPAHFWYRHS